MSERSPSAAKERDVETIRSAIQTTLDPTRRVSASERKAALAALDRLVAADRLPDPEPDVRYPECVANWPECEDGAYDPRCCRFPKSCSPVAADRLPDPRAGKERACKCGKMLVSNVIEVGFPCPFCGDKGGPVSAAVSPAEPPEAKLARYRLTVIFEASNDREAEIVEERATNKIAWPVIDSRLEKLL